MTFWLATTNGKRRALWRRLIDSDYLPVQSARPRPAQNEHDLTLVFDLDTAALHPAALDRIAGYVARQKRIDYRMARAIVQGGVTIPAEDCQIVEAVENSMEHRPLLGTQRSYHFHAWGSHEHHQRRISPQNRTGLPLHRRLQTR